MSPFHIAHCAFVTVFLVILKCNFWGGGRGGGYCDVFIAICLMFNFLDEMIR